MRNGIEKRPGADTDQEKEHCRELMKVLLYTHEFPPFQGGLATTSRKLAKGFQEAGIDTTVLAPTYPGTDSGADAEFDFTVSRMGTLARNHGVPSPAREIAGLLSLSRYLSAHTPDALVLITREAHLVGGIALDPRRYRIIVRAAGYEANRFLLGRRWKNRLQGLIMKRLYERADRIVGPSDSTKRLFSESGIPDSKLEVIHNGISRDLILREADPEATRRFREKYGVEDSEKIILTVSRLVQGKGQDKVIEALSSVRESLENFKYVIAGEGSYEKELRELARSRGLEDKVVFAGPVRHDEVWSFYDSCDVFAMVNRTIPSRENIEGLPNVLIEAASRGKPIITGSDGGSGEAVEHGKSGYVADGNDAGQIARYLIELVSDEDKRRRFGTRGRQKMLEEFTEEGMIESYLELIGRRG